MKSAESTKPTFRLKKPLLVWAIGCCFILAGPANIATVMMVSHVANWYDPVIWGKIFTQIPILDLAVCISGPVAGVSLLIRRKYSWLFAVAVVCAACVQNVYCIFFVEGQSLLPFWVPLVANSSVLTVFFYFRYPYLDRRDRIFGGISKRYPIALSIQSEKYAGMMAESISSGGCSLTFAAHQELPPVDSIIEFQMDDIPIKGLVCYHHERKVGVNFQSPRRLTRAQLRRIRNQFQSEKSEKRAS